MWASIPKNYFLPVRKKKFTDEYYGGCYNISNINKEFAKPIALIHMPELEQEALKVVKEWENLDQKRYCHHIACNACRQQATGRKLW
jgi:hypothetical protein